MSAHRSSIWTALVLAFSAWQAGAQQAHGPVMGFVVEGPGQPIFPMLGVPGAAIIGPAMNTAAGLSAQAASPRGDYVLALAGDQREPAVWLPTGEVRAITGAEPNPDRIVLSPEGAAAAFYYAASGRIAIFTGLPDAPVRATEIQLNPSRPPFANFAVSDDGKLVLAIENEAAVVLGAAGDLNRIALSGAVQAVAFAGQSHDAVLAGAGQALLIRNVEVPGESVALPAAGAADISSAAVSSDGHTVFLVSAGAGKVVSIRIGAGAPSPATLDCACRPDRLVRLNDRSYRLTGYSGASLYVLDGAALPPRIFVAGPAPEQDK